MMINDKDLNKFAKLKNYNLMPTLYFIPKRHILKTFFRLKSVSYCHCQIYIYIKTRFNTKIDTHLC